MKLCQNRENVHWLFPVNLAPLDHFSVVGVSIGFICNLFLVCLLIFIYLFIFACVFLFFAAINDFGFRCSEPFTFRLVWLLQDSLSLCDVQCESVVLSSALWLSLLCFSNSCQCQYFIPLSPPPLNRIETGSDPISRYVYYAHAFLFDEVAGDGLFQIHRLTV